MEDLMVGLNTQAPLLSWVIEVEDVTGLNGDEDQMFPTSNSNMRNGPGDLLPGPHKKKKSLKKDF